MTLKNLFQPQLIPNWGFIIFMIMGEEFPIEYIDKIMFKYFDMKYGESEYFSGQDIDSDRPWDGFFVDDVMILGRPTDSNKNDMWFSNGEIFDGAWDILGIGSKLFNESMKRYMNKRFPKINISGIV